MPHGVFLSTQDCADQISRECGISRDIFLFRMYFILCILCRDLVAQVLDEMPSDPTDLEDVIHSSLFLGQPVRALAEAAQLDVWLAAHLADIMESLQLTDSEADE